MATSILWKTALAIKNKEDDEVLTPDAPEEEDSELDEGDEDLFGEVNLDEDLEEVEESKLDPEEEKKVDGFFETEK